MSPLHVLHVLGYAGGQGRTSGITGVERVVQLLLSGLDRRRIEQVVAYPGAGALFDHYAERAPVLDLDPRRRFDPGYRDALAAAIRAHQIDVVVSHGLRFDFHAALAARRTKVPHLVVRAVALADEQISKPLELLYGTIDAWTLRSSRGIIAVSEASKRRMVATQHLPADKITVIPNGVELPEIRLEVALAARAELGIKAGETLIGGVGQLIPRKAFHVLIEALGVLRPAHPNLVCVLLGEGPERQRLEQTASHHGVRLLLPGFAPDPYPTMAAFDIAVLPSRAEGMPLVVLEAMALGVACIATPAAGTVEVIEPERSGLLVPPDDPSALAAVIESLLQDPVRRTRIAAAGAARVRKSFGLDVMLQRFDAALHAAVVH